MRDLWPLLAPRSVAIVGASASEGTIAGMPLRNLQAQGFRGAIYPVNPRHEVVGGLRCYPALSDLPEAPDLALVLVRAELVAAAVDDCARAGVRALIVFAGGFAEAGEGGRLAQARLRETASRAGMVCCGPNTLGVLNFVDHLPLTFARSDEVGVDRAGNIAVVSQSGGTMTALAARAVDLGIGLSYGVATGNEADLTAVEALRWLAEDPGSDALVAVLEEVRDGPGFTDLCRRLHELAKVMVLLHVGRSPSGRAAVASHTGALAGSRGALRAVLHQWGVVEAEDIDDVLELAAAAAARRLPAGPRLGVVTSSGGGGAMAADRAELVGLEMASFSKATSDGLRRYLPSFGGEVRNPLDATAQVIENPTVPAAVARELLADPGVDCVVSINPHAGGSGEARAEALLGAYRASCKPLFQVVLSGSDADPMVMPLRAGGMPVFRSPGKAVAALGSLLRSARSRDLATRRVGPEGARRAAVERALAELGPRPGERAAKALLEKLGAPVVEEVLAASPAEAASAADALGYPVVLKVHSPDIVHKAAVGGVALGVGGPEHLGRAYGDILASCVGRVPAARIDGLLVSRMVQVRAELIAGFHLDATFGPVVSLGLGGVWTEAFARVSARPAPLAGAEVGDMLAELWTGAAPGSSSSSLAPRPDELGALERLVLALSDVAAVAAGRIAAFDVNPVALLAGGGVLALDASCVLAGDDCPTN